MAGGKGYRGPGRARRPGSVAAHLERLQGGPPADNRHRSLARRPLPLCVLLGDGRAQAVRRVRPIQTQADGFGAPRRDRRQGGASLIRSAQRRPADGRGEPGRPPSLSEQRALRDLGRTVLSRWDPWLGHQAGRQPGRWAHDRSQVFRRVRGSGSSDPPRGWRRFLGFVLLRMRASWPWAALVVLGAYHGLNPGMGWLFAVARGLQDQRRSTVLRSLLPIAAGHEASIAVVVGLVAVAQLTVTPRLLPLLAAGALVVYDRYGLGFLRRAWFNMDLIWAVTLITAGIVTLLT